MTAADSSRIAVAATWSKAAGVVIVVAVGQLIATKGGLPVGSINSTLSGLGAVQGAGG